MFSPPKGHPYKITIDKTTGNKKEIIVLANAGDTVWVYSTERIDVFLCYNKSGVTFSCRAEFLIKQ